MKTYFSNFSRVLFVPLLIISCQERSMDVTQSNENSHHNYETLKLDDPINEIKTNFTRINSIQNWSKVLTKELMETSEGGEVNFYFNGENLEKIIENKYGEMFQQTIEYYLKDEELSFVFEKSLLYNRPIYYDEEMMKENDDSEYFSIDASKSVETRMYFAENQLLKSINSMDPADTIDKKDLENLTINNYQKLLQLLKN